MINISQISIDVAYMYERITVYLRARIALGYGLDDQGFESGQGLRIFLFTTASRPAEPTQPPIQWVSGALSLG
jgi:hypothetical protein